VYYGAGNDLTFRADTWGVITTFFAGEAITVEVESVTEEIFDHLNDNGATIVSRTPGDQPADFVKSYDGARVCWTEMRPPGRKYYTALNDPLFGQDKYI
jgi:hypothetical protein